MRGGRLMTREMGVKDRRLIYTAAFLRALATGLCGVILGLHLAARGLTLGETGRVISAGLLGAAFAALVATLFGDRVGRRRLLVFLCLAGGLGLIAVAFAPRDFVLAAAFLGMVNGMGRDRGAGLILDQAILPGTTAAQDRTLTFAWYNVCQDVGHALGGLLAAVNALFKNSLGISEMVSLQTTLALAGVCLLLASVPYALMSRGIEPLALPSIQIGRASCRERGYATVAA